MYEKTTFINSGRCSNWILVAPDKGSETWKKITDGLDDLKKKANDGINDLFDTGKE